LGRIPVAARPLTVKSVVVFFVFIVLVVSIVRSVVISCRCDVRE
jgi:hypothetical protein